MIWQEKLIWTNSKISPHVLLSPGQMTQYTFVYYFVILPCMPYSIYILKLYDFFFLSVTFKCINIICNTKLRTLIFICQNKMMVWLHMLCILYLHFRSSVLRDGVLVETPGDHLINTSVRYPAGTAHTLCTVRPGGPLHLQTCVVSLRVTHQLLGQAEVNHCT